MLKLRLAQKISVRRVILVLFITIAAFLAFVNFPIGIEVLLSEKYENPMPSGLWGKYYVIEEDSYTLAYDGFLGKQEDSFRNTSYFYKLILKSGGTIYIHATPGLQSRLTDGKRPGIYGYARKMNNDGFVATPENFLKYDESKKENLSEYIIWADNYSMGGSRYFKFGIDGFAILLFGGMLFFDICKEKRNKLVEKAEK